MNDEIKNIFNNFIVDRKNIDIAHLKYSGTKTTYVVWTIISEEPVFNADNEVQYSNITIDFDVYSEGNYLNIVNEIKNKMKNNGWSWIEDSTEMYEEDTKLYHRTSTFEKEDYING